MSNKDRVFVAVYNRPDTSNLSTLGSVNSTRSRTNVRNYHWGIYIEPKFGEGEGTSFDLEDSITYTSTANPFGWRLLTAVHDKLPPRMIVRIMIGKIPEGMTTAEVENVLRAVQLLSDPETVVGDVVAWIQAAIKALQEVRCAGTFAPEYFMKEALKDVVHWEGKGGREVGKVNFTLSRTFP